MTQRCSVMTSIIERVLKYLIKLSEKFNVSKSRQEKFQLLSLAPKSWGRKLRKVFGTSELQAIKVKQLVSEHGILILPNPKKRRALPLEIENLVKTFFERDEGILRVPRREDVSERPRSLCLSGASGYSSHNCSKTKKKRHPEMLLFYRKRT